MSLKTNSSTVFRLFGAGVKSFRLTCKAKLGDYPFCLHAVMYKVLCEVL